ncbi:MAG: hypothetical protein JXB62_20025 [Pirellulales bacterium]|nr:hypothetical protein [Pirellulales bacterium]
MADVQQKYGSSTTVTVTLAGLADAAWRQAQAVDNGTDLFADALVGGKITTGAGAGAGGYVDVFAAASADGGTTYGGDCSGSDAVYAGESDNLVFLGRVATPAAETAFEFGPFGVAAAFGGVLPRHWTLVFTNQSGAALDAAPAVHDVHYLGVSHQLG